MSQIEPYRRPLPVRARGEVLPIDEPPPSVASYRTIDADWGEPAPYLPPHAPARGRITKREWIVAAVILGLCVAAFAFIPGGPGVAVGAVVGVIFAVAFLAA